MFRMVADKLLLNLMEKNRFVCECVSLSSINPVLEDAFSMLQSGQIHHQ